MSIWSLRIAQNMNEKIRKNLPEISWPLSIDTYLKQWFARISTKFWGTPFLLILSQPSAKKRSQLPVPILWQQNFNIFFNFIGTTSSEDPGSWAGKWKAYGRSYLYDLFWQWKVDCISTLRSLHLLWGLCSKPYSLSSLQKCN